MLHPSPQGAALVALGALGLLARRYAVRRALDQYAWLAYHEELVDVGVGIAAGLALAVSTGMFLLHPALLPYVVLLPVLAYCTFARGRVASVLAWWGRWHLAAPERALWELLVPCILMLCAGVLVLLGVLPDH